MFSSSKLLGRTRGGVPPPQPNPGNVKLQVPFIGANGSTVFTDLTGKTITRVGTPIISTARTAGSGSSGLFNGAGDYLTVPGSADWAFGTGDWTVEGFVYTADTGPTQYLAGTMHSNDGNASWAIRLRAGLLEMTSWLTVWGTASVSVSANAFHHWAVSRSGNNLYLAADGNILAAASVAAMDLTSQNALWLAHVGDGPTYLNGNLEAVRVTKGQGLYTAAYAVPSLPLPAPT